MKKSYWKVLAGLLFVGGLLVAVGVEPLTRGWGRNVTVNKAPATISDLSLVYLSAYNSSTGYVYCLVNCDTNVLTNAVVQGAAVILPPGATFTFDNKGNGMIKEFSHVSYSDSLTVYASGF